MNYNDRYIIELARSAVFDNEPQEPELNLDWKYIYNKSSEQNITGLLFAAISKLDSKYQPSMELMTKWKNSMLSTIAVMGSRYNEFVKISKIMQDNEILFVGLKGCIVRNLYPVPELRTMGDFDILTNKSNLDKIAKIFEQQGYTVEDYFFGINVDNSKNHWEIFTSVEEEIKINTEKWNTIFLENCINDIYCSTLKPTYFLAHIIIHTARHFVQQGAGIRNLLDIALYIDKYKSIIDFGTVENICKEQNYYRIYNYILNSVSFYFKVDLTNITYNQESSEKFVEYMLCNGIFGKNDNVLIRQVALDEDETKKSWHRLLFPSAKALENRYKYLRQFPFLLPVAWIQRILYGRFNKKVSFSQMFASASEAFEFSDERIKVLTELDLKDKH